MHKLFSFVFKLKQRKTQNNILASKKNKVNLFGQVKKKDIAINLLFKARSLQ